MLIDGKKIAQDIIQELKEKRGSFDTLRLGVLMNSGDKAAESFVRRKNAVALELRVTVVRQELRSEADTQEAIQALQALVPHVQGIIVQLPLVKEIEIDTVLRALDPKQDVDGLGGNPLVLPPVTAAIKEIIDREHLSLAGKRIVLVGQGRLVGKPIEVWLRAQGIQPIVVKNALELAAEAPQADILILGAGSPGMLKPEMIQEGCVIFDAGTSEMQGKVVGDADPACAGKAALFTPVPGGIGPIAVAMIFKNLFTLVASSK